MADRLLERRLHPDWHGERTKLLYQFPTDMELWVKYPSSSLSFLPRLQKEIAQFHPISSSAFS